MTDKATKKPAIWECMIDRNFLSGRRGWRCCDCLALNPLDVPKCSCGHAVCGAAAVAVEKVLGGRNVKT